MFLLRIPENKQNYIAIRTNRMKLFSNYLIIKAINFNKYLQLYNF